MQYSLIILFATAAALLNFLLPGRFRIYLIASANILFYFLLAGSSSAILLPAVCLISWLITFLLEKHRSRLLLAGGILLDLAVMIVSRLSFPSGNNPFSLIGISFFMMEAISYIADVYTGKTEKGSPFFAFAYISFFPTVISGPIERAGNLFPQFSALQEKKRSEILNGDVLFRSTVLIAYSLFLKFVLADRLAVLVDHVFAEHLHLGSGALILGAAAYGFQLYCDFSSYSFLASALSMLFGIGIMDNFEAPYLCPDIRKFWNNWHISLSSWLKDYIYIPLGGSRHGKIRRYLNLLVTFAVSGLWHGFSLTFLIWGLMHGLYQIAASLFGDLSLRISAAVNTGAAFGHAAADSRGNGAVHKDFGSRFLGALLSFVLVDLAWIFFRASTLGDALDIVEGIFTRIDFRLFFTQELFSLGLDSADLVVLIPAFIVLAAMDLLIRRKQRPDRWLSYQNLLFRVIFVIFLVLFTLQFGIYGPGFASRQFIYAQF